MPSLANIRLLREIHVVADQDPDLAAIRLEGLDFIASLHSPDFRFVRCYMKFFVPFYPAVSFTQVSYVVQIVIDYFRHTARYNVDVVRDSQFGKRRTKASVYPASFRIASASER